MESGEGVRSMGIFVPGMKPGSESELDMDELLG